MNIFANLSSLFFQTVPCASAGFPTGVQARQWCPAHRPAGGYFYRRWPARTVGGTKSRRRAKKKEILRGKCMVISRTSQRSPPRSCRGAWARLPWPISEDRDLDAWDLLLDECPRRLQGRPARLPNPPYRSMSMGRQCPRGWVRGPFRYLYWCRGSCRSVGCVRSRR